jgi:hypothetical protein
LLATGNTAQKPAQQSYFIAARIAVADSLSDPAQQAALLRQAIAISPARPVGVASGNDLRLRLFRAEAAAGHDALALDAIQPLLNGSTSYSAQTEDANDVSAAQAEGSPAPDIENDAETADESAGTTGPSEGGAETLADLERLAPLPARSPQSDAEKLALARLIAQVYENTESPGSAVPYLKLAAYLEKDPKLQAELQRHVDQLNAALRLEAENASRRPHIQTALNQSSVVGPRLNAAELARGEAQ